MWIVWSHNFQASSTHKDPLLACGNTHSKQGVHFFETLITRFHGKCVCSVKFNHSPNQNHSSSSLTTKYGQSSLRFLEITHQHRSDRCWFHRLVLFLMPCKTVAAGLSPGPRKEVGRCWSNRIQTARFVTSHQLLSTSGPEFMSMEEEPR